VIEVHDIFLAARDSKSTHLMYCITIVLHPHRIVNHAIILWVRIRGYHCIIYGRARCCIGLTSGVIIHFLRTQCRSTPKIREQLKDNNVHSLGQSKEVWHV